MKSSLSHLPTEIQTMFFIFLADLDDASSLASVCKSLAACFHQRKHFITKNILLSSQVYQYDFHLSSVEIAVSCLAAPKDPTSNSPSLASCLSETQILELMNISTKANSCYRNRATSDNLTRIRERWNRFRELRHLYLDLRLSQQYGQLRREYAAGDDPPDNGDLSNFNNKTTRTIEVSDMDAAFKSRFHQALCLLSISIGCYPVAKATRFSSARDETKAHGLATNLWIRGSFFKNKTKTPFSAEVKLDCLEIFDYLYVFLMEKLIPQDHTKTWFQDPPSQGLCALSEANPVWESWILLQEACSRSVSPSDIM